MTNSVPVQRVQTGVRIEARLLNVLKALAALKGMSLGDLLEGIVLHAFEGAAPFSPETRAQIAELSKVYGLGLTARDSHRLIETAAPAGRSARAAGKKSQGSQSRSRRRAKR
jgi:hypothetical protein